MHHQKKLEGFPELPIKQNLLKVLTLLYKFFFKKEEEESVAGLCMCSTSSVVHMSCV